MLTSVDVFGVDPSPTVLSLPVSGALGTEPIQIRGIDGLGPVKADILTTAYGDDNDDEAYNGSRVGKRNIVIKLGLNPNWRDQTMEGLRQQLYAYFMPKTNARLRFHSTHLPTCEILGFVESLEPDMFSKDPQMVMSMICPKSDFVAIDETVINGVVGDPLTDIDYEGSRAAGITLLISSSVARPAYTGSLSVLLQTVESRSFVLDAPITIDATHSVSLKSVPGQKYVQRIVPTGVENLLGHLNSLQHVWPKLRPGVNGFQVNADAPGQVWQLSYAALFGGL